MAVLGGHVLPGIKFNALLLICRLVPSPQPSVLSLKNLKLGMLRTLKPKPYYLPIFFLVIIIKVTKLLSVSQ